VSGGTERQPGPAGHGYRDRVSRSSTCTRATTGRLVGVVAAVVLLATAACAGPTVTEGGYRAKTAGALQDISSALATAQLTMQLQRDGRMTLALTDTSISQAESDAASAQSSWQTRQPPTQSSRHLFDQVRQPMQDAVSALQDLRIAYRDSDTAGTDKALTEINQSTNEIDTAIQEASS
jgi:hypothetical protein